MEEVSNLSKNAIQHLLAQLKKGEVNARLPGGGVLHIEKTLPYLVIYRNRNDDQGTSRMVSSESSYLLIGDQDFKGYQKLLFHIADLLSTEFESYLLFEMYAGKSDSKTFTIKGPADKLPKTLEVLKNELNNINSIYSGLYLKAEIKDTAHRHSEVDEALMTIEEAKKSGALLVGLEVPPVYRDEKGKLYPVFFRKFRDFIVMAVHKCIYDFIRIQTNSGVASYNALGRKYLKDKVFEIDKKLSKIERSFQFLWLVSPMNIHNIKETFFKSKYEKVLDYHYRLLPIDPDILKRKLYNLKIEDIDDPAISYLFREKREELDLQISMLHERGTKNFYYDGVRLYNGIEPELCEAAEQILADVPEENTHDHPEELLDSQAFSSLARKEFDSFRNQNENFKCKVHIRKDVNIMMVSHGELYIPDDYKMNAIEAKGLIQHEVGTHVLTYFNGSQQPLEQLCIGLADYDSLQEGLAVMAEYLVGGLPANRLRTLAGRVIASSALMDGGDFNGIFSLLYKKYDFSPERAFNITSRIMQGGGFIKDVIYLKGLVQLREYLKNGGEHEPLLAGKFALKHEPIIKELTERSVLKKGALRPSYMLQEDVQHKLNLIRDGLPISKMIQS